MRSAPPEVIATWPKPNYVNPETRGPDLIVAGLITLIFAIIALILRLYVRLRIIRKTEIDDWFMVVATFFTTGATISIVLAFSRYGWDKHVWDLTLGMLVTGRKVSFATQFFFIPATLLTKISILLSYLRLAPPNTMFRRLASIAPWFIGANIAAYWIVLFTECNYWDLTRTAHDCLDETPILFSYAILSVIWDFFVWALPLPTIYRANLPLAQRLAIIALFSVGLFVVVAAAVRIYYLDIVLRQTYDVTWEGAHLWAWVAVEANLGIICGCVPWLKPLVRQWRARGNSAALGSGGNGGSGPGAPRSRPLHPDAVPTIGSGGGVFKMESLGNKGASAGGKEKGPYNMDLESGYASSEPEATQPETRPAEST